jgi:hypothetical protein
MLRADYATTLGDDFTRDLASIDRGPRRQPTGSLPPSRPNATEQALDQPPAASEEDASFPRSRRSAASQTIVRARRAQQPTQPQRADRNRRGLFA